MKNFYIVLFTLISFSVMAQAEGQSFCDGNTIGSYFPLDIKKKKIIWYNTYYFETIDGTETINGIKYQKIRQTWENNESTTQLLREDKGKILQYDSCCPDETIRFDPVFKNGDLWLNRDNEKTSVISYNEQLKTPYCRYTDLLALKVDFKHGSYTFYYQKGYGYIGATKDGKLISFASPEW